MRTAIKAFEANLSEELTAPLAQSSIKQEIKGLIHKTKLADKARLKELG